MRPLAKLKLRRSSIGRPTTQPDPAAYVQAARSLARQASAHAHLLDQQLITGGAPANAALVRGLRHELRGYTSAVHGLAAHIPGILAASANSPSAAVSVGRLLETLAYMQDQFNLLARRLLQANQCGMPAPLERVPLALPTFLEPIGITVEAMPPNTALVRLNAAPLTLEADEALLTMAVFTGLRNAKEALGLSRAGGSIVLSARQDRWGTTFIRIDDTGPGFPSELLPALIEACQHNDPDASIGRSTRPGGSGIGLSLMIHIAALHQGYVRLGNHGQGGAWVELALPRPRRRYFAAPLRSGRLVPGTRTRP